MPTNEIKRGAKRTLAFDFGGASSTSFHRSADDFLLPASPENAFNNRLELSVKIISHQNGDCEKLRKARATHLDRVTALEDPPTERDQFGNNLDQPTLLHRTQV